MRCQFFNCPDQESRLRLCQKFRFYGISYNERSVFELSRHGFLNCRDQESPSRPFWVKLRPPSIIPQSRFGPSKKYEIFKNKYNIVWKIKYEITVELLKFIKFIKFILWIQLGARWSKDLFHGSDSEEKCQKGSLVFSDPNLSNH